MDEETATRLRASENLRRRRQRWAMLLLVVGTVIFAAAIVVLDGQGDPVFRTILQGFIGLGAVLAVVGIWGSIAFGPTEDTERLMRADGYRDRLQRKRAQQILIMPVTSLFLTFKSVEGSWEILSGQGSGNDWVLLALSPIVSVVILLMIAGLDNPGDKKMKRLLEDELTVVFRQKALGLALAITVVGLCVAFPLAVWRPAVGVSAMPLILAVAAAAAAIRFALLNRQADPNG